MVQGSFLSSLADGTLQIASTHLYGGEGDGVFSYQSFWHTEGVTSLELVAVKQEHRDNEDSCFWSVNQIPGLQLPA